MNLTESQLFMIEALNRIEGFAWPEKANFAPMDDGDRPVDFWSSRPELDIDECTYTQGGLQQVNSIHSKHPDWRNSLITREQFESFDGWVRNDGDFQPDLGVTIDVVYRDGMIVSGASAGTSRCDSNHICTGKRSASRWSLNGVGSDIAKWRYHKPTKEAEMHNPETKRPTLLEILVRELPRRGGWRDGASACVQDSGGKVKFNKSEGNLSKTLGGKEFFSWNSLGNEAIDYGWVGRPISDIHDVACDHSTRILTKSEYMAEIARVGAGKDLNKWNDEVMDVANKISIDDTNNPEMKLSHNEIKERVSACFRGDYAESYKIESIDSIDSLYSRYELAKQNTKAGRDELVRLEEEEYKLLGEIERWNEERGFSVEMIGSDNAHNSFTERRVVITQLSDMRAKLSGIDDEIQSILTAQGWTK